MWSYVGKKANQRWLWHAMDHHTGAVLAYVLGDHKDNVFLKLKGLLEPFGITRFFTDDRGAYGRHLPPENHVIGKCNTQKIERKHLTLRFVSSPGFAPPAERACRAPGHSSIPDRLFRLPLRKEMAVLSSFRVTPMCTCPARRPRWCPVNSPYRLRDYSLPATPNRRLSQACARLSSRTTNIHFSGLGHAACTLATPGFIHTLSDMHAGSLPIQWPASSDGNQTISAFTHRVAISSFTISFPIPRIQV